MLITVQKHIDSTAKIAEELNRTWAEYPLALGVETKILSTISGFELILNIVLPDQKGPAYESRKPQRRG